MKPFDCRKVFAAAVAFAICGSVGAQKSNAEYIDELKAAGYPDLRALSFDDTKEKFALTGLYRSEEDKDPVLAFAEISPTKEGADISFRVNRPCVVTDTSGRLPVQIILIDGQKVEAYYVCAMKRGGSKTNEFFAIKSPAGNEFARKAFMEAKYVFVHLNGLPVPFATGGFSRAIAEWGGKAL